MPTGPPPHTPVATPVGYKMGDGFRTAISFALMPITSFWEREVKPVGIDGGEFVDTTTMRNNIWRTYATRKLKTLTTVTANCAWDPDVYNQLVFTLINHNGGVTISFPSGDSIDFWGSMVKFEPGEHKEGEMPIAAMTLQPTNTDDSTAEQPPVYNYGTGTGSR